MAESYLQHAEHYFRLIASAQQAQQQAAYGYQRPAGEQVESDDDDGDDDFSSLPDRFASPAERIVTPPQPAPQPYIERPAYNGGGDRQPYEPRQERTDRYERQGQDRQGQDRQSQDRLSQDRQPSQDRSYQDRQSQPERQDTRPERYDNRQERFDRNGRNERAPYAERSFNDRGNQADRPQQERPQQERNGQSRDYDNRGQRNGNRGNRDFRAENGQPREPRDTQPREQRQPDLEPVANALPAFITAPVRIQSDVAAPEPIVSAVHEAPPSVPDGPGDDAGFALRPRRRRRTKAEFSGTEGETAAAPAPDPVGD